jgi:hypothetical protein
MTIGRIVIRGIEGVLQPAFWASANTNTAFRRRASNCEERILIFSAGIV